MTGPQLNPYTPTEMKTLVLAPEVNIYILHNGVQYDVSADIVNGWVTRKENSASSLCFRLANKPLVPGGEPRYNAGQPFAFSRMDLVTVWLKRTTPIQVFTGFLDSIPYKQLYPGVVEFRATCTLKKLLHTWWNPATPANAAMLGQRSYYVANSGDGQMPVDSGLGGMLREILVRVGNWNDKQVHVQNFPTQFFPFVQEYLAKNLPGWQAAEEAFQTLIVGADHSAPLKASAGYNSSAPLGQWAPPGVGVGLPVQIAGIQTGAGISVYLPQIVAACDQRGLGPRTSNLQQSQALVNAGESGQSANDRDSPGWQQVAGIGQTQTDQENRSDAAILAVACILVESQWRNFSNPTVEESKTFPNDGDPPFPNLDSVGLFQQRAGWGNVSQRMNPFAAAGMFYERLPDGWRNMEEGAAIFKVQVGASPALYSAQVPAARSIVQAYREAQGKGAEALTNLLVPQASSLTSSVTTAINNAINNYGIGASSGTGATPAIGSMRIGKPNPDSEGALNAAGTLMITPYAAGGRTAGIGLDAAGLVTIAFRSIGVDVGDGIDGIGALPKVTPTTQAQRGDIIRLSMTDHIGMYMGAGMWLQTSELTGHPTIEPVPEPLTSVRAVYRACPNGGPDPLAPFTPPVPGLPRGMPPGTGQQNAVGAQETTTEPIARNLFSFQYTPASWQQDMAGLLPGEKAFIEAQPLIQTVQALCKSSLRNFQSAPNGDFIAYTPDQFGLYGKPAILNLEDIEIRDFRIDLSDEPLTTHVYIDGDLNAQGLDNGINGWITTAGVATMENEPLFNQLRKIAPGDMQGLTGHDIIKKFGVRPFKQTYTSLGSPALEFLLATQMFMGKFSSMYSANVTFTFMPELYPGMRVLLKKHNMQMYCGAVTHSFDYEQGFTTTAVLSAPSDPSAAKSIEGTNPLANWRWPSDNMWTYNPTPGVSNVVSS